MFVYYNGSKENFIESRNSEGKLLSEVYSNYIVFIKDDNVIYTHGEYFGDIFELEKEVGELKYFTNIKVNNITLAAAGKNGSIIFTYDDPIEMSIGQSGINIKLSSTFIQKVNNSSTNLGTVTDTNDNTAFGKINLLSSNVDLLFSWGEFD